MKILHVIDKLNTGGAEKMFVHITHALCDRQVHTGALLFMNGGQLEEQLDNRLRLHRLNRTNKYNPLTLYKAHNICSQYHIVHTHLRHVHAYIMLAKKLFGGRYKVILHDHAAIINPIPARLKGMFKPDNYIGVNEELVEWAKDDIGIKSGNAFLLENMVPDTDKSFTWNSSLNKAILIANIRAVKNIEFAIDLCRQMGWQLDIYGNVIEQEYYDALIQKIGDKQDIRMIQGITGFQDLYKNYSVAIHTSPAETGPLVLLEYLSAGLPFIAYNTGSVAKHVAEQLPQLLMNDFDIQRWQERVQQIIANEELPGEMKRMFQNKFSTKAYIEKCLAVYGTIYS